MPKGETIRFGLYEYYIKVAKCNFSYHRHDLSQLFPDVGFVDDSVFESHAEKINKVKPKVYLS